MKSPRLVLVTWVDSVTYGGWKFPEDIDSWMQAPTWRMESVGYLIRDTKDFVVLAGGKSEGVEQYNALTLIPKGTIKSIKTLKG